ncbi:S-adenosyl-L-methionine-dependent methyltransferase [Fomes fomentarius]|nr:S-adenosyl-L-methionine-dependent methyltransferase [Fomes fomentarius]
MPSPVPRSVSTLLAKLARVIGHESAQTELRWMSQALQHPPGIPLSANSLQQMIARRVAGEPLQYILGSQPFGHLNLAVRRPVLIPRPETEDWALRLADLLAPPMRMLDLCTGTGCIPLLLCHLWPAGSVHATGVDISEAAIQLAKENAHLCGIPNRNTFTPVLADLMHANFAKHARLEPPYDLITSNPPYIPQHEYDALDRSVREYEDVRALLGDPPLPPSRGTGAANPDAESDRHSNSGLDIEHDMPASDLGKGLVFYHRIAALIRDSGLLRAGGTLALEVGDGQAVAVAMIVEHKARLGQIDVWKDPWGKDRVVVARR